MALAYVFVPLDFKPLFLVAIVISAQQVRSIIGAKQLPICPMSNDALIFWYSHHALPFPSGNDQTGFEVEGISLQS